MDTCATTKSYHIIGRYGRGLVRDVTLTRRNIDYMYALFIHRVLPSDMLHALVAPEVKHRETTDRLLLLKNPPNDYVSQPRGQQDARNANYTNLVYEITEKGVLGLVECERITYEDYLLWKRLQVNYKPHHFDHDLATGYTTGSLELGARERGLRYITWLELFNRAKCPVETRSSPNPIAIPYESEGRGHLLIMDDISGIEYPEGACFFFHETDMGTEQHRESPMKSTTTIQKMKAYRSVMRQRSCTTRFGIPAFRVLVMTNSIARMHHMMEHLKAVAGSDQKTMSRDFLFKALPQLALKTREKLPATGHMLTVPWTRAQYPQIDLTCL